jgi:hypothetical protein
MERPPESLKSFGNRIARVASRSGASELIRLLRFAGLQGETAQLNGLYDGDAMLPQSHNPDHIGIWERKDENGKTSFVRRMDALGEWHFWASLGRIEPKGVKRRVVLIGESVARGYLYDPEFAPAFALEKILEPHFGGEGIEVIDLARTNLGYDVRELAIAALQLQPDVTILFAGNNWNRFKPLPSELPEIDEALLKEGIAGVKRIRETQIERNSRRLVHDIATAYESSGVPFLWIIPEFNLGDWQDSITNAPRLGKGLNREWLSLLAEAQTSLRDGDLNNAGKLANRMIEIDQGVCMAGFYILAECSKRSNDIDGERKYLELARDSVIWDSSRMIAPRTYSVTQAVLREETARHKYQLVDLPILFKEYLNGGIPGRRLFHDHCHLTAEGIQVAMSAAASCVLRMLKGIEKPWQRLVKDDVAPPPNIEAEASFLAAILNAHREQSYDLVHYFCARALKLSPHVAELMLNYIDSQNRRLLPMGTSGSEERIAKLGSSLMHRYLLRLNQKRLDKLLLGAIVNALEEIGVEARGRVEQLRREEHSVVSGEINLLDFYFCSATIPEQEWVWLNKIEEKGYQPDADFYRAYWPESRFIFVGEARCALTLLLTCRLPSRAANEETISVLVNGKPQVDLVITGEWSSWIIQVDNQIVGDGLNEVAVRWPIVDFDNTGWIESVRQQVSEEEFPEFYPIFGEIHSFTASRGQAVSTSLSTAERELAAVQVS